MEKIIEMLDKVYKECLTFRMLLQTKLSEVTETAKKQKELMEGIKKKESLIAERESQLTNIENLEQYRKDADVKMEQAQSIISDYTKRTQNFAEYERKTKDSLKDTAEALDKRENALNIREANLEAVILEKVRSVLKK